MAFNKVRITENSPCLSTVVYESIDPLPTKELRLETGATPDEKFFRATARWYFRPPFAKVEVERRRLLVDVELMGSSEGGDPTVTVCGSKAYDGTDECVCKVGYLFDGENARTLAKAYADHSPELFFAMAANIVILTGAGSPAQCSRAPRSADFLRAQTGSQRKTRCGPASLQPPRHPLPRSQAGAILCQ